MKLSAIGTLTNTSECVEEYRKAQLIDVPGKPYSIPDEELKALLPLLNAVKGVATTDSCASHPSPPQPKTKFYVAFLLDEEGFTFMAQVVMAFVAEISENMHTQRLMSQVMFTHRLRIISREYPHFGHIWTLSIYVPTEDAKTGVISCFEKAVNDVINRSGTGPL